MTKFGKMEMPPEEARMHAANIRRSAGNIKGVLDSTTTQMNKIDNDSEGIYSGNRNSHELRMQLDEIKAKFDPLYGQIIEYAKAIEAAANVAENL